MDFATTLSTIAGLLRERELRFALIGGHGLAALGLVRATLDLDLVAESAAQDEILEWMEGLGYETLYRSPGYSNHLHPDPRRGRVDFVYVRGETADRLFAEARTLEGPGGVEILVPRPEHLAAMKIQAMRNDPSRRLHELADIQFLLELPGVDRELIRSYFERYGMEEELDELG